MPILAWPVLFIRSILARLQRTKIGNTALSSSTAHRYTISEIEKTHYDLAIDAKIPMMPSRFMEKMVLSISPP